MKIGIDARLINETGVGRYIRNLIAQLGEVDTRNSYIVFVNDRIELPNSRWQQRLIHVPWHSFTEQILMPYYYYKEHFDLLHVPYFNIPLLYFGKFVVTIHDLTILHFDTGKATTLPYLFYKIRRLGYYISLLKAIFWSEKVIAVSQTTKCEILDHFDVLPEHIAVVYEG